MNYLLRKFFVFSTLIFMSLIIVGCSKEEKESTSVIDEETVLICKDISTDTLSFVKDNDDCNSIVQFTYDSDVLSVVWFSDTYSSREKANNKAVELSSKSDTYTNVSTESKTINYSLSEDGIKDYSSISKEEIIDLFKKDGYVCQ